MSLSPPVIPSNKVIPKVAAKRGPKKRYDYGPSATTITQYTTEIPTSYKSHQLKRNCPVGDEVILTSKMGEAKLEIGKDPS
jgi:hypothetical protein